MSDPAHSEALPVLRCARPEDRDFLFQVYASTREEELSATGWDEDQKRAFLFMQFSAQDQYYRNHFPHARFDVIEVQGTPVGRFYVDRSGQEVRIIDIALLPASRCQGMGTMLLSDIILEAKERARTVVIHVERHNRAFRLYCRLGFEPAGESGLYRRMVWQPGSSNPQAGRQEKIA
jgi:ribosomal protein S18 acetylase RimI-like enzyme